MPRPNLRLTAAVLEDPVFIGPLNQSEVPSWRRRGNRSGEGTEVELESQRSVDAGRCLHGDSLERTCDRPGQRRNRAKIGAFPLMRLPVVQPSTRLEAFSDAAFAFALTLLVVSLEVPRSYAELMDLMYGFPAFACCFTLLVWIWYQHDAFFRKYPLEDPLTVAINGLLLFVVLFYVYPLKFMFDSMFAMWLPAPNTARPIDPMALWELGNAAAVYGFGFLVLFLIFALLYFHASRKAAQLELTEDDLFDLRTEMGHHLMSASVGALAMIFALVAPLRLVFISPMLFILMGPAHFWWGTRRGNLRAARSGDVVASQR